MLLGPSTLDVECFSLHCLFLVVFLALERDFRVAFSSVLVHIGLFRGYVSTMRATLPSGRRQNGLRGDLLREAEVVLRTLGASNGNRHCRYQLEGVLRDEWIWIIPCYHLEPYHCRLADCGLDRQQAFSCSVGRDFLFDYVDCRIR